MSSRCPLGVNFAALAPYPIRTLTLIKELSMTSHSMRSRALAGCALFLLLAAPSARAAVSDDEIARYADQLFSQAFPADEPGAAVLVAKDDKVLLRKGYGMADLELGVPIQPDMVFKIASVTKQFTAAAILLLQE